MTAIGSGISASDKLHPAVDGDGKPPQPNTNGHAPSANCHRPETRNDTETLSEHTKNDASKLQGRKITLRRPGQQFSNFAPPSPQWLAGKWNITHSSLPTWRDKKNVAITYTLLDGGRKLDDTVEFQFSENGKVRSVSGTQTQHDPAAYYEKDGTWDWHGRGLIKLAKAHWECLGWGRDEESGVEWMVTFFVKTAFTPDGINVYARAPARLPEELLARIQEALLRTEDKMLGKLAAEIVATGR